MGSTTEKKNVSTRIIPYSEIFALRNIIPFWYDKDNGIIFCDVDRQYLYRSEGTEYYKISSYFEVYRNYRGNFFWLYLPSRDMYMRVKSLSIAELLRHGIVVYDIDAVKRFLLSMMRGNKSYIFFEHKGNNKYQLFCYRYYGSYTSSCS